MPHQIGTGTANLSLNMPIDEKAELGKLAFRLGFKGTGDLMRALVLKGLEQQDVAAAEKIKAIRRAYYGAVMLAVFLGATIIGHDDLRRPSRRVRMIEERVEEVTDV